MRDLVFFAAGCFVGVLSAVLVIRTLNPPLPPSLANEWGTFPAPPQTEWLADGRRQKLLADFVYVDPRKRAWVAPQGAVVDGASIPRPLWSVIGGPFEDKYRNASIVHDTECVQKSANWADVHRMFYEACRCGGLSEVKSKLVYAAVYNFGPRWPSPVMLGAEAGPAFATAAADAQLEVPELDAATLKKLENFVNANNPSLEQLETLDVSAL